MESLFGQGDDADLCEVYYTGKSNDGAVDAAKGCEAKDFCCVVTIFVISVSGLKARFGRGKGDVTYDMAE